MMPSSGTGVHLESIGEGEPTIVFLHPTPADSSIWVHQLIRFSRLHRVVAVDLPGYGRSPGLRSSAGLDDVAATVWKSLDAARVDDVILIAISAGSTVAQRMTALRPQRVRGLVLTGGGYFTPTDARFARAIQANIERFTERGPEAQVAIFQDAFLGGPADAELVSLLATIIEARRSWVDVQAVLRFYRLLLAPTSDRVLRAIRCPVLVISGGRDPGHDAHHELARRIRGARFATIRDSGHVCAVDRPDRYDSLIERFLAENGLLARPARQRAHGDRGQPAPVEPTLEARLGRGPRTVAFVDDRDPFGLWFYVMAWISTWSEARAIRTGVLRASSRFGEDRLGTGSILGSGDVVLIGRPGMAATMASLVHAYRGRVSGILLAGAPGNRSSGARQGAPLKLRTGFRSSARGKYLGSILRHRTVVASRGRAPAALGSARADLRDTVHNYAEVTASEVGLPQLEQPVALIAAMESYLTTWGVVSRQRSQR